MSLNMEFELPLKRLDWVKLRNMRKDLIKQLDVTTARSLVDKFIQSSENAMEMFEAGSLSFAEAKLIEGLYEEVTLEIIMNIEELRIEASIVFREVAEKFFQDISNE